MFSIFEKYKNKIALKNKEYSFTYEELKTLIAGEIEAVKNKKNNVIILSGNNFNFVIQLFACLFCDKNIYLITDKNRLKELDFEFDILEKSKLDKINNYNFPKLNTEKGLINFFTSGSSGKPKVIQKSLYNLYREAQDIGNTFDFENKDYIVKSTTTMCHLFGLTFHLMTALVNGLTIDTEEVSYPENIDEGNIILVSTPAFLSSAVKFNLKFKIPPKYIISAGSKLDEKVFEQLEKSSDIIEIYGSSESGVIAHKTHFNSSFEIFKNVKVQPNENYTEIFSDYSFGGNTIINDKVEVYGQNLKIQKRTDRLFKIQEKRVSAEEIEEKLKINNFVKDCYIIKIEDKLACLCALSEGGRKFLLENNITKLTKGLKTHLLKYSEIIPQKWKYIDEIPLNSMGKINKKLIEHLFNVNLSFPVILERKAGKDSVNFKILFYSQCNFFKGHFPKFQLVPGVTQLYIAKEFANFYFNLNLGEGQWKRIKFSNIIKPDSIVNLKLEKTEKNVSYEFYSDDKKYASGLFLCDNIFEGIWSKEK